MHRIALLFAFVVLTFYGSAAYAGGCEKDPGGCPCNPEVQICPCDPEKQECPPPPGCNPEKEKCQICHNIGGPRDLGANCDMTGNCSYPTEEGGTITVLAPNFLGIIIGFNQDNAKALGAHLNHGDGFIVSTFDPPLHLASVVGPHQESNVECLATRVIPQPPELGN